jgi:transcription elongation factor Elf1
MEKAMKKICHCQNCGNESEMIITCSLPDSSSDDADDLIKKEGTGETKKLKGTATCKNCGNEADMWIDY